MFENFSEDETAVKSKTVRKRFSVLFEKYGNEYNEKVAETVISHNFSKEKKGKGRQFISIDMTFCHMADTFRYSRATTSPATHNLTSVKYIYQTCLVVEKVERD